MSEAPRVELLGIRSDPKLIRDARRWLTRIVTGAGWSAEEIHDLAVVLSEACSNAHRYAYDGRNDGRIDLRLELRPDEIELSVRDYGRGFDPHSYRSPDLGTPRESGYGIHLMQQLTDRIEHRSVEHGALVVMTKRRREQDGEGGTRRSDTQSDEVPYAR